MIQTSVAVRNAQLDAAESAIGTAPDLQLRTGLPPSTCADAATGTLLATLTLPSDWMAAASSAVKLKSGTWSGTGVAAGSPGHFRIVKSGTCHMQGTVTAIGGGGDLELEAPIAISIGGTVTIDLFSIGIPDGSSILGYEKTRLVTYTATGSEGTDFMVSIGSTLANDTYEVGFFGAKGAAIIPAVWDFPNAVAGDRTTTQFRVLIPAALTAADVFVFEIVETP